MPSLYHFNSDQFKENLMLGGQQHMVAGRLCQYLKGWQLDGIRFLYKHFEKGEACILNDESGLGKVVTVAVFLGAILTNDTTKKCLIIVPDDEHIEGWRFHLSVLTQLTVKVIERTSDINYETVFLIKWSTLKNIGQITKVTFDHIIIDNRGEMLTNKFCTGILLRYYENKTSIVISSADVTADIKLLHILLRLCGRLDKQYADVKTFEDKFQLPKLKDGVCSKVDLEDYFLKREKVINFCRDFRLRRYCHQFDEEFPLVPSSEFKRHLEHWRSSDNSQSSGSVKLLSSSSEKDVEELFQAYFQVKQERDSRKPDCEVQQIMEHMAVDDDDPDVSDEVVVMSPLLFVSESESDSEQTGVRNEMSCKLQEDIKDEEDIVPPTIEKEVVQSKKSISPVRRITRNLEELPNKKSLRSRIVPNSESPMRELTKYLKLAQKLTDNDTNTPKRRGRKPKVKKIEDEATSKRLQDEEKTEANDKSVTSEKNDGKETTSLPHRNEHKKGDEQKREDNNLMEDKRKLRTGLVKSIEYKKGAKDDEKNKQGKLMADTRKSKCADISLKKDQVVKEKAEQDEKKKSPKQVRGKKTSEDEELAAKKTPLRRDRANIDGMDNEKKKELTRLDVKQKPGKEKSSKTTPSKLETRKRAREEEVKEKRTSDGGKNDLIKKTRSKSDEENKTPNESEKQSKGNNEKTRLNDVQDQSKQAKEEENKKRRAMHNNAMNQAEEKKVNKRKTTKPERRNPSLLIIIKEANKFLNTKYNRRLGGGQNVETMKRTRTPQNLKAPPKPTTSPSRGISSPRSLRKPSQNSVVSPKSSTKQNVKPDSSKRSKPLTVYAPLGVHNKSTRGMQRCTRSCPIQNKYMKVAMAQVDIDKTTTKKTTAKRVTQRRPTATAAPKTPPVVEPKPPTQNQVSESPAPLESMQLGQALTPTSIVPDFAAPSLKSVDYNFPLMLDKDIPDTECIITSPNNTNNNEIIVLTGSSTISNEMEPPKSTISRRKATIRPPMVAIPRPSYNKAKSPDLFSTCSQVSLPCSQQHTNKSIFEGFKLFGSELRQPNKQRSCLDILERIPDPRTPIVAEKKTTQQHCIDDEDAMFEITSNFTFGNLVRVNSKGEVSPISSNKGHQSTPPPVSHPKNRITNYLISNNQYANGGAPPSSSLEDAIDQLPKTPKRRKSLSGTVKRSPRALSGGITGGKSQSTKLTQWLVKNAVVRISETPQKPLATKRRRLDLSFPDN